MSALSGSAVLNSGRIFRHDRMSAMMKISRRRKDFIRRELLVELAINFLTKRANIMVWTEAVRGNGIRGPQKYPLQRSRKRTPLHVANLVVC
ncbi:hypothetical protein ACE10Z_34585 [Bradyrhizobium sp. Pha-3]|uniref:hypothetical protein n=1 Tax=Bradyrhizobium sp. Pha-3 TaxID=208375 RepID=UPI0035D3E700